eukprot:985108-Prorocentrum_minimum.AAC.2
MEVVPDASTSALPEAAGMWPTKPTPTPAPASIWPKVAVLVWSFHPAMLPCMYSTSRSTTMGRSDVSKLPTVTVPREVDPPERSNTHMSEYTGWHTRPSACVSVERSNAHMSEYTGWHTRPYISHPAVCQCVSVVNCRRCCRTAAARGEFVTAGGEFITAG